MRRIRPTERGNSVVEFALVATFLAPLLAGTWTIGMSLVKAIQVNQVCRNANVLMVRGVNLADTDNQKLLVRTANGLKKNRAGTSSPDPNGQGVVYISRVQRVTRGDCINAGIKPDKVDEQCDNLGLVVITMRATIGNKNKADSALVTDRDLPPLHPRTGEIPRGWWVRDAKGRAKKFGLGPCLEDPLNPTPCNGAGDLIALQPGQFAWVAEALVDISYLDLFSMIRTPLIYAINVS